MNHTRVDLASLAADEYCGTQTKLIHYMDPGEVLSRPFTARDTHSPEGKLLVMYTDAELAGGEHVRRSMASAAFLGLHGLSFTYGTDLILPAEINAQLRTALRDAMNDSRTNALEYQTLLDFLLANHIDNASIFVPEVLWFVF